MRLYFTQQHASILVLHFPAANNPKFGARLQAEISTLSTWQEETSLHTHRR